MIFTTRMLPHLPACFSRASANLWPVIGMRGLGAALMEHAGPPRPGRGAMKCDRTSSGELFYQFDTEYRSIH
jgi:hypothetical protein